MEAGGRSDPVMDRFLYMEGPALIKKSTGPLLKGEQFEDRLTLLLVYSAFQKPGYHLLGNRFFLQLLDCSVVFFPLLSIFFVQ